MDNIKNEITFLENSEGAGINYSVTPYLRYVKRRILIDEQTAKYELRLQQMWQGSDGSQKWEWIHEHIEED
jgi:hypothetical protein